MSLVHHQDPRSQSRFTALSRCSRAPDLLTRTLAVGLLTTSLAACGGPTVDPNDVPFLEGSALSMEALGEGVLNAFVAGDTEALEGFRLDERQHNEIIWPELPASAPEVNYPIDLGWQNIESRNARGVARLLPILQGRPAQFDAVECRGETESFETFRVLTDCYVVFHLEAQPNKYEIQLFQDVLVRAGGHKIFRYYDEEPRAYRGSGPTRVGG